MMVRDLLAGYQVRVYPVREQWGVALTNPEGNVKLSMTHDTLPDALATAHEWLMLLVDETELRGDIRAVANEVAARMREYLARRAAEEPGQEPTGIDNLAERDKLRWWIEREMGW